MVLVIWADAARDGDFDGHPMAIPEASTVVNHTIGFLVESNAESVTLVQDITPDENTSRWPYGIPRGMVQSVQRLAIIPPESSTDPPTEAA